MIVKPTMTLQEMIELVEDIRSSIDYHLMNLEEESKRLQQLSEYLNQENYQQLKEKPCN